MGDKNQQVNSLISKLKNIATSSLEHGKINKALSAVSFAAETLYMFNQYYVDENLEMLTAKVADSIKNNYDFCKYPIEEQTDRILVYDGFGFDTRGVILMYLNALGLNGYEISYVTNEDVKGRIPTIEAMCKRYHIDMKFIDMSDYKKWCLQLAEIFEKEKPRAAFFYTTPFDAAASATFHMYEKVCTRYLIDLTDHAFWLGKCANDFFLGSREMSAYIEHYQRGIPKEKCIKLGVNLLVENVEDHSGLPFDPENTEYIFSGGSLYKTLGDPDNVYYKIVHHILENHKEIKFLYAGAGDDSELKKILTKFPEQAFHINERKDFYYLIKNSIFYLNTYPMFGGMMMKYSALAHRLPITLKHGADSEGLLLHQDKCLIEYNSADELMKDVDRLLDDEEYRHQREKLLEGSVITEERFVNNIRSVIEENKTDYSHEFLRLDTTEFRKEYYERFEYEKHMQQIVNSLHFNLCLNFPRHFLTGMIKKVSNKKRKGIK